MTHNSEPGYFDTERQEIRPLVPENALTVLEVGCGAGRFLGSLRTPARRLVGIEPFEAAAVRARQQLDEVLCMPVELALPKLNERRFDCIVVNDVLEHLLDPWTILKRLRALLTPSGCVVASMPNSRHWSLIRGLWVDGDWTYQDAGLLDRTHLRFFTPASMKALFETSGLHIEHIQGIKVDVPPLKFRMLSLLFCQRFNELQYKQYAIRASAS